MVSGTRCSVCWARALVPVHSLAAPCRIAAPQSPARRLRHLSSITIRNPHTGHVLGCIGSASRAGLTTAPSHHHAASGIAVGSRGGHGPAPVLPCDLHFFFRLDWQHAEEAQQALQAFRPGRVAGSTSAGPSVGPWQHLYTSEQVGAAAPPAPHAGSMGRKSLPCLHGGSCCFLLGSKTLGPLLGRCFLTKLNLPHPHARQTMRVSTGAWQHGPAMGQHPPASLHALGEGQLHRRFP